MRKKVIIGLGIVLALAAISVTAAFLLRGHDIAVLNPEGEIAQKQLNLIIFASALSLLIIIPVFALTGYIVWKYRIDKKSHYSPDWDQSRAAETIWWVVPTLLILVLSVVTWKSSHELDPYKPIISDKPPITVRVIALQWKWLFIYPEQHIASVNYLQIPEKTPINFEITSDAPMNSFWIPKLGGQVYAMAGMQTKLHLMANQTGDYAGSSANISGSGFAGMKFVTRATTESEFMNWTNAMQQRPDLNIAGYDQLAKPSKNNPPAYFSIKDTTLYDRVMMKYMMPGGHHHE
jgi:cytochrome o ubiquinol oxidase subunit 2